MHSAFFKYIFPDDHAFSTFKLRNHVVVILWQKQKEIICRIEKRIRRLSGVPEQEKHIRRLRQ